VRSVPRPASHRQFALRLPAVATRDASDRLLPSHFFVSVPVPRTFSAASDAFAPAQPESVPAARQSNSLRWAARSPLVLTVVGVVFPPRCVRTEPLTPLSPPSRGPRRSRVHESSRGPPRPPSARSRERDGHRDDPRCLPSSEDLCPAAPFRAPGSGLFQLRGLATAVLASDAFGPPASPCGNSGVLVPVHVSRCRTGSHASLDLGVVRRLLQP
jgi:hypothetical protein